jgi:hypothetical protein
MTEIEVGNKNCHKDSLSGTSQKTAIQLKKSNKFQSPISLNSGLDFDSNSMMTCRSIHSFTYPPNFIFACDFNQTLVLSGPTKWVLICRSAHRDGRSFPQNHPPYFNIPDDDSND